MLIDSNILLSILIYRAYDKNAECLIFVPVQDVTKITGKVSRHHRLL